MNDYIVKLKETIVDFFINDNVKIILFGSRARKDYVSSSDVDVGILGAGAEERKKISLLKGKISDMNIPYKVEIVDFSSVSEKFKKEALEDAIVWKD